MCKDLWLRGFEIHGLGSGFRDLGFQDLVPGHFPRTWEFVVMAPPYSSTEPQESLPYLHAFPESTAHAQVDEPPTPTP